MRRRTLLSILALSLVTAVSAFSQTNAGTLLGTVVDSTQAVVQNATVTLRNTATGAITTTTTNSEGVLQLPSVAVGSYLLRVAASGFKTYEMNDISLLSTETRNVG